MATDPRVETIRLLTSIDATLKQLLVALASEPKHDTVDDAAANGPHGDPVLKFTPRDWTGESHKGRNFSTCPPDLLDLVAEALDYFAGKADDPKKAKYDTLDAKRARAWAARLRAGWQPPTSEGF